MKFLTMAVAGVMGLVCGGVALAADGVDDLRAFVSEVKTGRAQFTQVVTSGDGLKKKNSNGYFEFSRPNRFRFVYSKPFEQVLVGDGQKVWMYDPDLNQVSTRSLSDALGATPAALLSGNGLDKDFDLSPLPAKDGLTWAKATPRVKESNFQYLSVGFRGKDLAALEIIDSFGQRSMLQFADWKPGVTWSATHFEFVVPAGADVLTQ